MSRSGRPLKLRLSGADPFEDLMQALRPRVERDLQRELAASQRRVRKLGRPVEDMVAALSSLCLRGGKRLRAGLLATGYLCTGRRSALEPAVLQAGLAVELLQAYFLIHDDWMDRDEVRRGGPSVHTWLTTRIGDPHLGAAAGVLTGDFALALATQALSQALPSAAHSTGIWDCFARMQLDAIAGQQRDLLGADDVRLTYRLKTSSYTVHGPLELGARFGGASPELLRTLARYSIPTGLAFQIRDDLLNAFGDPKVTGKPLGSDLVEGKRTLLVATALERLHGRERVTLLKAFGNRKANTRERQAALGTLRNSGAVESLEQEITKLARSSQRALRSAALSLSGRALLEAATASLVARTA